MKNKLYILNIILIVQTLGLLAYTGIAIYNDGWNFFERALDFAVSLKWMWQFALDFQCYLILSALWIAWRNKFSFRAIVLAIIAMILGIIILAPYLLYLIQKENGNLVKVLIADRRVAD